jgi:SAM-dependent methyltransferase
MGHEIDLLDRYPRSKRPIDERGRLITPEHRAIARRFDVEYFDQDRLTGYGGYNYHPRFWTETVKRLRDHYQLAPDARVLDVGCAKGFMLYDFRLLMPELRIAGVDVSQYALDRTPAEIRPFVQNTSADELPFADRSFDLVISINTIHNLPPDRCRAALKEIQRVSAAHAFVTVDAWRSDAEREQLLKWNLTALTYMHVDDWKSLFRDVGYTGDYYWFIAE